MSDLLSDSGSFLNNTIPRIGEPHRPNNAEPMIKSDPFLTKSELMYGAQENELHVSNPRTVHGLQEEHSGLVTALFQNDTILTVCEVGSSEVGNGSLRIKLKVSGSRVTSASMVESPVNHYDLRHAFNPHAIPLPLKMEGGGHQEVASALSESGKVVGTDPAKPRPPPPQRKSSSSVRKSQPKKNKKGQPSTTAPVYNNEENRPEDSISSAIHRSDSSMDETKAGSIAEPLSSTTNNKRSSRAKRAASARVNQIAALEGDIDDYDNQSYAMQFWTDIEEYRSEFTSLDVDFCTASKSGIIPSNSPFHVVPPLGPNYRETWVEEDERDLKKGRESSGRAKPRKKEEAEEGPKGTGVDSQTESEDGALLTPRIGTLTSRLVSAFCQETLIGQSFYNRPGEFDMEIDDYIVPVASLPTKKAHIVTLNKVESRLSAELKALGLFIEQKKPPNSRTAKPAQESVPEAVQVDEIQIELAKAQKELIELTHRNAEYRETHLLPRVFRSIETRRNENKIRTEFFEREERARVAHREMLKRKREIEKEKKDEEPPSKKHRLANPPQQGQGRTLPPPKPEILEIPEIPAEDTIVPQTETLANSDADLREGDSALNSEAALVTDDGWELKGEEEEKENEGEAEGDEPLIDHDDKDYQENVEMSDQPLLRQEEDEEDLDDISGVATTEEMQMIEMDLAEDLIRDD